MKKRYLTPQDEKVRELLMEEYDNQKMNVQSDRDALKFSKRDLKESKKRLIAAKKKLDAFKKKIKGLKTQLIPRSRRAPSKAAAL